MHFLYLFYWLARSLGLGVGVLHNIEVESFLGRRRSQTDKAFT